MGNFFRCLAKRTPRLKWPMTITYMPSASSPKDIREQKGQMLRAIGSARTEIMYLKHVGDPFFINETKVTDEDSFLQEQLDDPRRPLVVNLDIDLKLKNAATINTLRGIEYKFFSQISGAAHAEKTQVPDFQQDQLDVEMNNPDKSHQTDLVVTYDLSPFPYHIEEKYNKLEKAV